MNKTRECLLSSFRGALEIKKLEETQKALIARNMNLYADKKHLSQQRTVSLSSSVGSSYRSAAETSVKDVGKIKPCGYLTLLDVSTLTGLSTTASSALPDTEFVPNSFHQKFHVSRWQSFVQMTPKWILEMGMEGLNTQQHNRKGKTQEKSDKGNFNVKENSDSQLLQKKHDNGNNVVQECTVENPEMEKELGSEEHRITVQEIGTSACTEEWRDWSLQLTGQGSLIITGKADKNVINRSRDVSSCQRVDARTLRLADGMVYKLVGMPDHFTNLPYYIRNKFQCGFPDDWKEVKLAWEKYEEEGSPCGFSWLQAHLSESRKSSTVQKDKTVRKTSCPVEESKSVESSPAPLNSVVQSLRSDKSRVQSVDRVGEAQSRLTVQQELEKQLDAEETEACNQKLNSTMAQECGKRTVVEGRDAARVVQPSIVTVQEGTEKSDLKTLEVCLKRLSSHLIEKCIQRPNVTEMDIGSKCLNDNAVSLLEQSGTVPFSNVSSVFLPVNTDRPSSCDTSNLTHATVNTTLGVDEVNTLVNPYILHRWTPVLVAGNKLKLMGYLKSTCSPEVLHTTDVVQCRKDSSRLKCCDGTFYRLQGSCADPQNNIPNLIQKQLHEGLPYNWRKMIATWVDLLAVIDGQLRTCELGQNSKKAGAPAASKVEQTKSADPSAGRDELVDETVQPTAAVTSLNERAGTELSTASDENDSVNEAAMRNLTCGKGSLFPLRMFEGQGIIKKSSRGRVVFPPVRYWLGERLVQQHNQPAFFCPRTGVQEVIVNQRVDSFPSAKKRKCLASESESLSLSKRRCRKGETKFVVPREKHRVLLHGTWYGQDWKGNSQASKGRRALEDTDIQNHRRFMPKQQGSCTRISESYESLSDDISIEAREGSRILNGQAQMFEGLVASKSASSSHSLNSTVNRRKKCSLGTQKHEGLEDFKGGTSKQRRYVGDLCDSEDKLLADVPTSASVHYCGAYKPPSVRSASPPVGYFTSLLGMEDKAYPSRLASSPGQQHRGKELDRFVKRQQIMDRNVKKSLLEPTTGTKADQFGTANDYINQVVTVHFDDAVDEASSFDEDDLSTSCFSMADSGK